MSVRKNKAIKSIAQSLERSENKVTTGNGFKTLAELTREFMNTPDKKSRAELTEEFKARRLELAEFLKDNPELIAAEARQALVLAAIGGELEASEIQTDNKGNRKTKKTIRQTAPDTAALLRLLEDTDSGDDNTDDGFINALKEAAGDAWNET